MLIDEGENVHSRYRKIRIHLELMKIFNRVPPSAVVIDTYCSRVSPLDIGLMRSCVHTSYDHPEPLE